MTKQEFMDGLKAALQSTGDQQLIRDNMLYYNNYITTEEASGRSEEEILEELGDPRLIARSIKNAGGYAKNYAPEEEEVTIDSETGRKCRTDGKADSSSDEGKSRENGETRKKGTFGGKLKRILIILAGIFLLLLFGYIFFSVLSGIIAFLGPIGIILIIIIIFSRRRRRRR